MIPTDPATGKVDYIELDSPVELLYAILSRSGEHGLMVDRLCAVSGQNSRHTCAASSAYYIVVVHFHQMLENI